MFEDTRPLPRHPRQLTQLETQAGALARLHAVRKLISMMARELGCPIDELFEEEDKALAQLRELL